MDLVRLWSPQEQETHKIYPGPGGPSGSGNRIAVLGRPLTGIVNQDQLEYLGQQADGILPARFEATWFLTLANQDMEARVSAQAVRVVSLCIADAAIFVATSASRLAT